MGNHGRVAERRPDHDSYRRLFRRGPGAAVRISSPVRVNHLPLLRWVVLRGLQILPITDDGANAAFRSA